MTPTPTKNSSTSISVSGWPGDYTLTAVVTGGGSAMPTGTVSFLDSTNGNAVLGTADLSASNSMTFTGKSVGLMNDRPIAAGDFNGDGNLDLLLFDNAQGVLLYPGNGDGTFSTQTTVGSIGNSVALGDFNGDGKLDIAGIAPQPGNFLKSITVELGDGNGGFPSLKYSPISNDPNAPQPSIGAVGDFDGDGILDLAINSSNAVIIFHGNGDGTFTALTNPTTIAGSVLATGDFNGDGIPDLIAGDSSHPTTLYLANGDGTFTAAASPALANGQDVEVGDFNNDGKLDLLQANENGVAIYLGNGDGTFTAGPTTQAKLGYPSIVGDFNGDGILDIVTPGTTLFGNGDGTFTVSSNNLSSYTSPIRIAGDFNNDGIPDLLTSDNYGSYVYLTNNPLTTATAVLTNFSLAGTGGAGVEASYPGDSNYNASVSSPANLVAEPAAAAPVISPAGGTFNAPQTVIVTDASPGVLIYFTTDGSTPTPNSPFIAGPINVSQPTTIKALAYGGNYAISPVTTANFVVNAAITSLGPEFVTAGLGPSTLYVSGTSFTSTSVVYWGTTQLTTHYVDSTQLTVGLPDTLTKNPGQYAITVQNSSPDGATSNSRIFEVDSAPSTSDYPAFSVSTATVSAGGTAAFSVVVPSSATNVSATCLNLPAQTTCNYSASSGAISISTSASTPKGSYEITVVFNETLPGSSSSFILVPFLLLPLMFLRHRLAAKGAWSFTSVALVLLVGAIAVSGCGGSGGQGKTTTPQQVTASGIVELTIQ